MARAGIWRSQWPNLCHAKAKSGTELDIVAAALAADPPSIQPHSRSKSGQSPGTVFTQPGAEADARTTAAWYRHIARRGIPVQYDAVYCGNLPVQAVHGQPRQRANLMTDAT